MEQNKKIEKVVNPREGCFKFSVDKIHRTSVGKPKPTGISGELRKSKWKILVSFGGLAGCKKSNDAEALVSPSTKVCIGEVLPTSRLSSKEASETPWNG